MPLDSLNRDLISFKKVVGKAHTQEGFAFTEEGITSNIPISYSTIFGEPINADPSGLTATGDTDGIVEKVRFEIEIIPDTEIGTNQSQGYRLKLPSGYSGQLFPQYSGNTFLHTALGKLQIVPPLYGELKPDGSTPYDPVLLQTDGVTEITKFDPINWILDTYNGILFVQDPPAGYDVSANRPAFLEAFLYVGDYLDEVVISGGSAASGERIQKQYTQVGHGFALGDVIAYSASTFVKALAVDGRNEEVIGVVTEIISSDIFVLTFAGHVNTTGFGLLPNNLYYLSDTIEGELITVEPTSDGTISKPIIKTFAGNTGVIIQSRGVINDFSTSGATISDIENIGGGSELFAGLSPTDVAEFRTLSGTGGIETFQSGNTIIISGGSSSSVSATRDIIVTTATTFTITTPQNNVQYLASGTTTYDLPLTPSQGEEIIVSDGLGNASSNNITINGNGNLIIGSSTALINSDYGSLTFLYNGFFWSVISFVP